MLKRSLVLAGMLLVSTQCTHKSVMENDTREPAGLENLVEKYELQALSQLFGNDSPLGPVRRKMSVSISTSGDGKYLSETAKKALQEALVKTLSGDGSEQALAKVAAGNIKAAIINNFIKTLKVYKIVNVGVQADLTFTPEPNSRGNYDAELASNQLVRLDEKGKLSQKMEALENFKFSNTFYNNSAYIPQAGKDFQYVGGMMSLYFEILDSSVNLKLPNPFKNGVKGYVRYRRYYKTENQPNPRLACSGFKMSSKRAGEKVPLFYTVDLYSNFNLSNIIPTEEALEVFPGRLVTGNEGRPDALPKDGARLGKSITTASYAVESPRLSTGAVSFGIKKIVYSLKEKSIDLNRSEVDVLQYIPSTDQDDQAMAVGNARRTFLKACQSNIKKDFYINSLVEGGTL
ncbi:hypothetical protein D3C87_89660 [compost metagenome]